MNPKEIDWDDLTAIIDKYKDQHWGLIPLLQHIQEKFGYIPPPSIDPIARALGLYPSQVQGGITFYAGFSLGDRLPRQGQPQHPAFDEKRAES